MGHASRGIGDSVAFVPHTLREPEASAKPIGADWRENFTPKLHATRSAPERRYPDQVWARRN
jgi:hypothetical protein